MVSGPAAVGGAEAAARDGGEADAAREDAADGGEHDEDAICGPSGPLGVKDLLEGLGIVGM
jgi:hypothetical protein